VRRFPLALWCLVGFVALAGSAAAQAPTPPAALPSSSQLIANGSASVPLPRIV